MKKTSGVTPEAESLPSAQYVYVVGCIEPDGEDVRHIFSTAEKARAFAHSDPRPHVLYDYLLDCPERHEGRAQ